MAACAVCGAATPAAKAEAPPEKPRPNEVVRTFGGAPSTRLVVPRGARSCARCGAALGPDAKFCRGCGEAVTVKAQARSGPPRENVVPMHQPAPEPDPEPAPPEVRHPGRHISLAYLDDEVGEGVPAPAKLQDIDYLDAQLGLTASDIEPAPLKPPAWRLGRQRSDTPKAHGPLPEEPGAPVPVPREPRTPPQPSGAPSLAVVAAAGFALLALGIAALVHYFAPTAIAGYSAAEFGLKVQMRAVEWLLAGILVGIVGLLLKR